MAGNSTQAPASGELVDEIMGPVKVTPLHVQDRATSKVAGAPMAWSKRTVLEQVFDQERMGAKDSSEARNRFNAGQQFTQLWDCSQSAGRDSTAAFDVGRSMGSGVPLSEAQRDAISRLVRIEMRLGQNDRTIVRAVCALGYQPVEAIALAKLPKDTRVTARFCEAMDALVDAMERTARSRR